MVASAGRLGAVGAEQGDSTHKYGDDASTAQPQDVKRSPFG